MSSIQKSQNSYLKRNWKWVIPISLIILAGIVLFTLTPSEFTTDLVQAYADKPLYENALQRVKADERVAQLLGEIKSIDKLAILEGEVE